MEKGTTCCFTGHRPHHLPWGENERSERCLACKALLAQEVETAWQDGFRRFFCGMARGADLYWAEAVLAARTVHPELSLFAAIPCDDQTNGWPESQVRRYRSILARIPEENIIYVQHQRTRHAMIRRDQYMVDVSSRVIALYDGLSRGGTQYTLRCAMKQKREIVIIDPRNGERIV